MTCQNGGDKVDPRGGGPLTQKIGGWGVGAGRLVNLGAVIETSTVKEIKVNPKLDPAIFEKE